jgi:hypothetical protein
LNREAGSLPVEYPLLDLRLERIEDEMRGIAEALKHLTRVDERLKQHRQSIEDHEERLRLLEAGGQKAKGSLATLERVGWVVVTVALAGFQLLS